MPPTNRYTATKSMFSGLKMASTTPVVDGMPVLKNTANTTSDALPHSNSSTMSTSTSMAMLLMWPSQQVREADRSGGKPASRLRLTSYRPMARNGPTSRQPDAIDSVYSGLWRNTAASTCAMLQKAAP